jgi:hypothetical protein
MKEAVRRTLLFTMERYLVRGAHYRFLLVVGLIGVVSISGGLILLAGDGSDKNPGEAIWWAFLRLSDPGYLGDDEGLWQRSVSTVLTVLGYVIFMGAMVAILTQWLNGTLNQLAKGLTPIRAHGHVAILGWTNRTGTICRELVIAEGRLSRWLELRGIRRLKIAILAEDIGPERYLELRDELAEDYRRDQFVLRSGDALRPRELIRVDVAHAACIVLPGIESTSADAPNHDAAVIKTLRSIAATHGADGSLPTCVCEIFDPRKVAAAQRAYGGPVDVVASDVVIGRLLGDSLRQPGLSSVYAELVTHGIGGTLYVRPWEEDPTTVANARRRSPTAVLLGIVSREGFRLAIGDDGPVATDESLVFVARAYVDTTLAPAARYEPPAPPLDLRAAPRPQGGRVLVLGWSRRVPDLLVELDSYPHEHWQVTVVSAKSVAERQADLDEHGSTFAHTEIDHRLGDSTIPATIMALDPTAFDRVLIVASDWPDTGEQSDARTISTYLALAGVLDDGGARRPPVLVELTDASNLALFDSEPVEVVVSPLILSRVLAQVVLRSELLIVINEIFGTGESELSFTAPKNAPPLTFAEAAAAARADGAIALGLRRGGPGGQVVLAADDDEPVDFADGDALIVLRPGAS